MDDMIEAGVGRQVVTGARSPPFGVLGPVNDLGHPCVEKGPHAHDAGLNRHIEGGIEKAKISKALSG